ncbi:MAG: DUF4340 domain-containing protein [Oscillospiraceae bacterium]|nr:DUF4340 domain-containing protein [Oscillospiraceae bacterium]
MTRGRRTALIGGSAALFVLAAGITVLVLTGTPEAAEPSPSPSPAQTVSLIAEDVNAVNEVVFTPQEGDSFRIVKKDTEYTLELPGALFPGVTSSLSASFRNAANLTGITLVAENADDGQLALFGLTQPAMRWEVKRADGTSDRLMLGVESATGTGRYARREDERAVYLLTKTQSDNLIKQAEAHYDLSFVQGVEATEESPAWSQITRCLLEKNDGEVIEILKRTEEETADLPLGSSTYHLVQPREGECNEYNVEGTLMTPAIGIKPGEIVETEPEDLSAYGLDNPSKLTLTTLGDWSGTLLIGNFDSERGGRYVMIEGINCVLLDTAGTYGFLNATYANFRTAQIWLYDIKESAGVTFELEGVTRELTFEHHDDETLRGFLDGKEMTGVSETGETNARRLYMAALRVMHSGGTDAEVPPGEPQYRLTMHFVDGRPDETMELYAVEGERQYLIILNGENLGLYVNWTSLRENLLDKFALVDEGQDIPRL